MPKTRRPVDPRQKVHEITLDFSTAPVASAFLNAVINGCIPEICCFGTRGDGKTIAALTAMIGHAQRHQAAGGKLPVPWMGVTDTFTSHKLKTLRSLENPLWGNGWRMSDGDHVATFVEDEGGGKANQLVRLDLFGIEDQGAMDRVRMETVGLWFEEPAPAAVLVQSSGISDSAWLLARTSQRLPSYFHPAVITTNYPDEDHWTWRRFVIGRAEGTCYFRVPPGERASKEQREEWMRALADRPDLLRRLLEGEPGTIMLGDQVAQGFEYDYHVAKESLKADSGTPLVLGFDFGHTPTVVIASASIGGGPIKVLAGLYLMGAGMKQLCEELLLPWLGRFAPWTLKAPDEYLMIGFDPSQGTMDDPKGSEADAENAALVMIQQMLGGGDFLPGPIHWPNRKDALVRIFNRRNAVVFDPKWCGDLIKALNGRWYYPKSHIGDLRSDLPKKPNHPWEDLGDAFVYMLCRYGVVDFANPVREVAVATNLAHDYLRDITLGRHEYEVLTNVPR